MTDRLSTACCLYGVRSKNEHGLYGARVCYFLQPELKTPNGPVLFDIYKYFGFGLADHPAAL